MCKPHSIVSIFILAAQIAIGAADGLVAAPYDSTGLEYQTVKFEKTWVATDSRDGATFQAEFPEFVGGALPDALDAINAFVRYYLPVSSEGQPGYTVDELANRKMDRCRRFSSAIPNPVGSFESYAVTITYNKNGLLCLKFYWWSSGGAHPIDRLTYFNFDLADGRRLQLSELLVPGYQPKLDSLGEREFRSKRNLGPETSLDSVGFHFKGSRFALNENVAIDSTGLLFHFNDYEIAAHVFGPQVVTLSFEVLAELLPRGGHLAKLAELRK